MSSGQPTPVQPKPPEPDHRLRHGLSVAALSLLITVLLYVILRELTPILRPLFVAVFLCYLIVPIHRWLRRRHVPAPLSYILIVGALSGGVYTTTQVAYQGFRQFSGELQSNTQRMRTIALDLSDRWSQQWDRVRALLPLREQPVEEEATTTQPTTAPLVANSTQPQPDSIWMLTSPERVNAWLGSTLASFAGTFLSFVTGGLVVAFYMIFLLLEQSSFSRRLQNAFGSEQAAYAMEVVGKINAAVARYITVKTFVSVLIGAVSTLILSLFGVKYALMWGVFTFFANFIPYIGSMFAVALPICLSFIQFYESPSVPIFLAVLLIAAQQLTGSFLEPRLLGERLGISPLLILLSLAFWGYLWGVPGMILSAPLAVSIKIILENIEQTRPVGKLFSNI